MIARSPAVTITNASLVAFGSAVFIFANLLLALGLTTPAGLCVFAGSTVSFAIMLRLCKTAPGKFLAEPVQVRTLAACAAVALVLCLLGGEGHVFYANDDWLTRDAVLADMARHPFPIVYTHKGSDFLLRAPLGMYMLPAAIGQTFGLGDRKSVV